MLLFSMFFGSSTETNKSFQRESSPRWLIYSFIHAPTEHLPSRQWPRCPAFSCWNTEQVCSAQVCLLANHSCRHLDQAAAELLHLLQMQLRIQKRQAQSSPQKTHGEGGWREEARFLTLYLRLWVQSFPPHNFAVRWADIYSHFAFVIFLFSVPCHRVSPESI